MSEPNKDTVHDRDTCTCAGCSGIRADKVREATKPTDEPAKVVRFVKAIRYAMKYVDNANDIIYLGNVIRESLTIITTQAARIDKLNQGIIDRDSAVFAKIRHIRELEANAEGLERDYYFVSKLVVRHNKADDVAKMLKAKDEQALKGE